MNKKEFLQKVVEYNIFYKKRFNKPEYIERHLQNVFGDIDLKNKKVLDVGGGAGLLTLYAALNGASKAICLEPELEGSTSGFRKTFEEFKKDASFQMEAENLNETFQSFCAKNTDKYDLVIFQNSVNHLDEPACEVLLTDEQAVQKYKAIFDQLHGLLTKNGTVIISDCSRTNFFNSIGLKSPFAMTIEWNKHQDPGTWIRLLKESGFKNFKVGWTSHEALGKLGDVVLGNKLAAFFLFSHFKLVFNK